MRKLLCLMGLHQYQQFNINFFDLREINEECQGCGKRRFRFDKSKKWGDEIWQRKRRWFWQSK
jgi:hypothetical protein